MCKKAVIKVSLRFVLIILIIVLFSLALSYSLTDLYPNCGCFLENIKTEKAYIKSQLRHENDRVYLDQDEYVAKNGIKKEFLIGVINKFDNNVNLRVDIKEVNSSKNADVIKSGLFEYDYEQFILEPKEIRLFPIYYHNDGFIGRTKFVAYVRNIDFPYGDSMYNYSHISIYMNVEP
ncbi:hypothetical protein HYV81_03860 [Candidatus Woesearchaeota archaeon]|nr:hypothetical protein [Candidatus Woesearchaeota archaeon]